MPGVIRSVLGSPVVAALTAPHSVDRFLEHINPLWAVHEIRARVVAVRRETTAGEPVATLTLQPTSTWPGHRAGQHVQVGLEVPGARRTTRVFSISSAASGPGEAFTITLRANPDGVVSKHLVHAEPGTIVHLSEPLGDFVLPATVPQRLLFLSGGSGLTPVTSMMRTLLATDWDGRLDFVHFAQSPEHQIFADELAALDDPRVRVRLVHGDLFTAEGLERLVPDHAEVDTWACGPGPMIELVQGIYGDDPRLRLEFFKPPRRATGEAGGTVEFAASATTAENDGRSLLEQAEAAGLRPEFGCRMGICFSCTARKTEGTVRHVITGATSSLPDEDIQICVQAPEGDCTVEI
ncbi:ferredoxin reductase [Alteromonas gracilis]